MSLKGNVRTLPLADILQFIGARQNTGTLELVHNGIWKRLYFEKGRIISAGSSDPTEYLGHFLISENKITEDQLTQAMEVQEKTKVMLGKILVMIGAVSEDEMLEQLELKCKETVYSMFLWEEADFEFFDNQLPAVRLLPISLEIDVLSNEGRRRKQRWDRLRKAYPTRQVRFKKISTVDPDQIDMDRFSKSVFVLVDGNKTIADIAMHCHSNEFKVLLVLEELKNLNLIASAGVAENEQPKTVSGIPPQQMIEMGKNKLAFGKWEEAINLFTYVLERDDLHHEARDLLARAEQGLIQSIYETTIHPHSIPQLSRPLEAIVSENLTSEESFLVSRINGRWDLKSILTITPLREVDALRILKRLIERKLIRI